MRMTEDDNTEHSFFVYALNKNEALNIFLKIGYKKSCVLSINEL